MQQPNRLVIIVLFIILCLYFFNYKNEIKENVVIEKIKRDEDVVFVRVSDKPQKNDVIIPAPAVVTDPPKSENFFRNQF